MTDYGSYFHLHQHRWHSFTPQSFRHRTGLRSFIPSKVDIEKPEFESEAFRYMDARKELDRKVTLANFQGLHLSQPRGARKPSSD